MSTPRTPEPELAVGGIVKEPSTVTLGNDAPELVVPLAPKPTKEPTMSRNPNAIAVLASSQAALAGEALVSKYLGAHLGTFWSQEVIAGFSTAVVYVGRNGIKRALGMICRTLKSVWTGPSSS